MLPVAVFVLLVVAVALLAWRRPKRVQVRTCCAARPWPPVDLVDDVETPVR